MIKRTTLLILLLAGLGPAQVVNCLVAVVNGEAITLLDLKVVAEFDLGTAVSVEGGQDPRRAALDALIDRKVVLDLAREAKGVSPEEVDAALAGLSVRMGEAGFSARLKKYGLTAKDLGPYLRERILFDKAMALRFSQAIPVPLTDIERYYRTAYLAEQSRLGRPAEPLAQVSEDIASRLREERRAKQVVDWVKSLRARAEIRVHEDCLRTP